MSEDPLPVARNCFRIDDKLAQEDISFVGPPGGLLEWVFTAKRMKPSSSVSSSENSFGICG